MFDFKEFRKVNNFTQSDAADYFGCKQSFISLIETNRSKIPSEFIVKILSDANINRSTLPPEITRASDCVNPQELLLIIQSQQETINRQSKIIETLTSK